MFIVYSNIVPMERPDHDQVTRAANGDRHAFTYLYEKHVDEVYRFVAYRVNQHETAEEITAQLFYKAWRNLPQFEQRSSFRSWLFRMANNAVIDHYRTRRTDDPLDHAEMMQDERPLPEQTVMAREQITHIRHILTQLSPAHQEVLTLRFINGLSPDETAVIMERTAGSVRVLQHRALKAAHALLAAEQKNNE